MQCFASESRFESAAPDAAELANSLFHSLDTHLRQLLCHIYSLRSFPLGSQHLLKRLAKTLSGQDRDIMESILRDFALKNEDGM